jgi:hypothetical protein
LDRSTSKKTRETRKEKKEKGHQSLTVTYSLTHTTSPESLCWVISNTTKNGKGILTPKEAISTRVARA